MVTPCISDGQIGHIIIIEYWLYYNRIRIIYSNCHICVTFERSLSKRYLIDQLLCHSCYTYFTQVARNGTFWPNFSFRKKNQIRISCEYAHLQSISSSPTRFHEILWDSLEELRLQTDLVVYLILVKFLSSKGTYM